MMGQFTQRERRGIDTAEALEPSDASIGNDDRSGIGPADGRSMSPQISYRE
jgi:hypothetical protein